MAGETVTGSPIPVSAPVRMRGPSGDTVEVLRPIAESAEVATFRVTRVTAHGDTAF